MKKRDIVNLIRYHVEGNENAFREEVYGIANEFDASGDNALAEYIMALMSDTNILYTQNFNYESEFLEEVNLNSTSLYLPATSAKNLLVLLMQLIIKQKLISFYLKGRQEQEKLRLSNNLLGSLIEKFIWLIFQ